jgi:hypothetical protein
MRQTGYDARHDRALFHHNIGHVWTRLSHIQCELSGVRGLGVDPMGQEVASDIECLFLFEWLAGLPC